MTKYQYQEIFLSPNNYILVTISSNIWSGFKDIGKNESIISNYLTLPHNEREMVRKDPQDNYFNYNW
jgi:dTDP-4-dehydrorhamnose 3,5-epimerase-like enzyme